MKKLFLKMQAVFRAQNLPKDVEHLILEFKAGIDLWEGVVTEMARDDRSYSLTPYEDSVNWDNCDSFYDHILCAVNLKLILAVETIGCVIDGVRDEELAAWMTGSKIDLKVGRQGVRAIFELLNEEIQNHTCYSQARPTMDDWFGEQDNELIVELLNDDADNNSISAPLNRHWHRIIIVTLTEFELL